MKQAEMDQAKAGKNPWVRIIDNCEMIIDVAPGAEINHMVALRGSAPQCV